MDTDEILEEKDPLFLDAEQDPEGIVIEEVEEVDEAEPAEVEEEERLAGADA